MGARARVVWVRGALGPCRCVVWRSSVLGARCGRGLPVKEPGLIALWQGDQRCGRSVGSWMACGGRQGWSGTRVLGVNRGSRHSTFSGRAHWSRWTEMGLNLAPCGLCRLNERFLIKGMVARESNDRGCRRRHPASLFLFSLSPPGGRAFCPS